MNEPFDIAIAGGGIAAMSAALTAARLGCRTLCLAGDVPGGNLLSIEKVDGFPGFAEGVAGYELCPTAQMQAAEAGAEFVTAPLDAVSGDAPEFTLATREGEFRARTLIVATGCDMKALGVPGEERLKGKGVSHCASCDGPMLRDQVAVVVGGGDSAMQESLTLAQHAGRVVMLVRGQALRGQATYRERVLAEPKIEVRYGSVVEEILGEDVVTGVRLADGTQVEASAVFVYIGFAPNTAFLGGRVKLDAAGRIVTDASMATDVPGMFAAGTLRSGSPCRAAASAGDGVAAATAAHAFLNAK